jgi:bloom syndrome protein
VRQRQQAFETIRDFKMIYITPEFFHASENIKDVLLQLYKQNFLVRLVIDEAHCLSQWGRDFRNDYLYMRVFRELYPKVPITALTATATDRTKVDVINILKMKDTVMFKSDYNRANLNYIVRKKEKNNII